MSPSDSELLRHATLEILAARFPTALSEDAILRRARLAMDIPIDAPAISSALALLAGLGLARQTPDPYGSTLYWAATSSGILSVERGSPQS